LSSVYKCPKCGHFVDSTYNYCPYCDTGLTIIRNERGEKEETESVDYIHELIAEYRRDETFYLVAFAFFLGLAALSFLIADLLEKNRSKNHNHVIFDPWNTLYNNWCRLLCEGYILLL